METTAPTPPEIPAGAHVLVTGLTGQDGYYLAKLLLGRGCELTALVWPGELEAARATAAELGGKLRVVGCDLADDAAVFAAIEARPPEVAYHLAAQSSVGISWRDPLTTARVNTMGTIHLLEGLRRHAPGAAFVMAGSCDCYDHEAAGAGGVTPQTPFLATNPYASSKIMAHEYTRYYRTQFGLRASVAVLFNHTSPRRPELFVERGIIANAVRVALGQAERVVVGDLTTRRDWSWAPEIVEGFALMGGLAEADEIVLGSGRTHAIGDWVDEVFELLGLDRERQLAVDPARCHPNHRTNTHGDISRARRVLGWQPRVGLAEMTRLLAEHDQRRLAAPQPSH